MLPTGNIARIIDRWNCWSTKRTRDDNHLLNGSRNWTGGGKLLSGDDYELQKNMITWVIVRLLEVDCSKCDSQGESDCASTSRISMGLSCYCSEGPARAIKSGLLGARGKG